MERIYQRAFCINMLLSKTELIDQFVHVICVQDYSLKVAKEFTEKDMLKTAHGIDVLFDRLLLWQCILTVLAVVPYTRDMLFSYTGESGGSRVWEQACKNTWLHKKGVLLKLGIPVDTHLGDPIDIMFVL